MHVKDKEVRLERQLGHLVVRSGLSREVPGFPMMSTCSHGGGSGVRSEVKRAEFGVQPCVACNPESEVQHDFLIFGVARSECSQAWPDLVKCESSYALYFRRDVAPQNGEERAAQVSDNGDPEHGSTHGVVYGDHCQLGQSCHSHKRFTPSRIGKIGLLPLRAPSNRNDETSYVPLAPLHLRWWDSDSDPVELSLSFLENFGAKNVSAVAEVSGVRGDFESNVFKFGDNRADRHLDSAKKFGIGVFIGDREEVSLVIIPVEPSVVVKPFSEHEGVVEGAECLLRGMNGSCAAGASRFKPDCCRQCMPRSQRQYSVREAFGPCREDSLEQLNCKGAFLHERLGRGPHWALRHHSIVAESAPPRGVELVDEVRELFWTSIGA